VADKQLAAGIPLPTFPGVTFQSSVVTMEQEYVLVGLDFQFTPSTDLVLQAFRANRTASATTATAGKGAPSVAWQ
jgi:hypothetical protein